MKANAEMSDFAWSGKRKHGFTFAWKYSYMAQTRMPRSRENCVNKCHHLFARKLLAKNSHRFSREKFWRKTAIGFRARSFGEKQQSVFAWKGDGEKQNYFSREKFWRKPTTGFRAKKWWRKTKLFFARKVMGENSHQFFARKLQGKRKEMWWRKRWGKLWRKTK